MDVSGSIKKRILKEVEALTDLNTIWMIYNFIQGLLLLPADEPKREAEAASRKK